VRPLAVKVNPKLKSQSGGGESPPKIRLTVVCDWDSVGSPGISGFCGLIRKRLIAGERLILLHGPLDLDVGAAEEVERMLTGLRLPVARPLISADRVAESLLRLSLVKALVGEGLPAVAVSGVDLGLFRRDESGELRVDASRLTWLLGSGVVPVIGPDCLSPDQSVGRTTAAEMTQTLAGCRDIHSLDVLTPTDRVLQFDGSEALALHLSDLERLRTRGPDHFPPDPVPEAAVEVALAAMENGVPTARIGSIGSLVSGTATEITQGGRGAVVR
jgi:acetylglutamate kinase